MQCPAAALWVRRPGMLSSRQRSVIAARRVSSGSPPRATTTEGEKRGKARVRPSCRAPARAEPPQWLRVHPLRDGPAGGCGSEPARVRLLRSQRVAPGNGLARARDGRGHAGDSPIRDGGRCCQSSATSASFGYAETLGRNSVHPLPARARHPDGTVRAAAPRWRPIDWVRYHDEVAVQVADFAAWVVAHHLTTRRGGRARVLRTPAALAGRRGWALFSSTRSTRCARMKRHCSRTCIRRPAPAWLREMGPHRICGGPS